jgi:hypothetical protein
MMVERMAFGLFILGIGFLSYLYGVASARFGLFPYEFVHDAWIGGKALQEVWANSFDKKPPGALSFEAEPGTVPNPVRHEGGALPNRDLILMTGGPYELMSECPELGCLAWIMDRAGIIYHTWPIDRAQPWGETGRTRGFSQVDDVYPEGMHLYDNGDLLVSYQARDTFPYSVGLAKFDRNGKLLWKNDSFSHHWFYVDKSGMIYAPSHEIIGSPLPIPGTVEKLVCEEKKIYEDVILILSPDGAITRRISVLQALFDSGYGGLIALTSGPCDPLHLNDVRLLTKDDAHAYRALAAGDMLISLRNLNTIAILDSATARVKWITSGQTVRQHAPRYLGANDILVFDNLGGPKDRGGSRLAKINLATKATATLFPVTDTPQELNFYSEIAGQIDLDAARERVLVSLTMQGRQLEIDLQTQQVIWQYDHVFDITKYMELTGQGAAERYARFGINGAYYVDNVDFLVGAVRRMAVQ